MKQLKDPAFWFTFLAAIALGLDTVDFFPAGSKWHKLVTVAIMALGSLGYGSSVLKARRIAANTQSGVLELPPLPPVDTDPGKSGSGSGSSGASSGSSTPASGG